MPSYRPNGRRRLGRPFKRLLVQVKQVITAYLVTDDDDDDIQYIAGLNSVFVWYVHEKHAG